MNAKERHDAELFYLKWIAKQIADGIPESEQVDEVKDDQQGDDDGDNDGDGNENENENEKKEQGLIVTKEMKRIDRLYPRYIELTKKYGAMNLDKKVTEKLMAITVTLRSMDPESITAKPVDKKLPTTMTVAQLKLLCKRLFKLNPQHQRLTYRAKGGVFPEDMYDDTRPLSFYNLKDGMEILMQSSNFDKK